MDPLKLILAPARLAANLVLDLLLGKPDLDDMLPRTYEVKR